MRKLLFFIALSGMFLFTGCLEKLDDENLYTFTGETITDYLVNRPDSFSEFVKVLEDANMISLLATRGSYTCFAPTNTAMSRYLQENGLASVDSMTHGQKVEMAYGHILNSGYLTTDLEEGAIPLPNMNDRYLTISFQTIGDELAILVNKKSRIIRKDAEVVNGVVQTMEQVLRPSNSLLPDLMGENDSISLFNEALNLTGLDDSMRLYIDYNWQPMPSASYRQPEKRRYGFTALVETNKVFRSKGIHDLEDLKAYAKSVYDEVYPQDANRYDTLYTHRKNPLNRFIAYHLMNRRVYYNNFYYTLSTIEGYECYDYFEMMCPFSLMRTSNSNDGIRLNASIKYNIKGIKVLPSVDAGFDQNAINGIYHYIDNLLVYDKTVRETVLNERIRVDVSSMLPELMNNGYRKCATSGDVNIIFNSSYFDWVKFSDDSKFIYHDPPAEKGNTTYQGDEFFVQGVYDVTIKLPPVPEGTYEIRFGYFGKNTRGIAQFYFDDQPCGIPLDLTVYGENVPKIGWVRPGTDSTDLDGFQNDKMMRNRGYMKGPNSIRIWPLGDVLRYRAAALRRIVTTKYLTEDEPHYFRARSVLNDIQKEFLFDYFELCPKSVYDSEEGEDIN